MATRSTLDSSPAVDPREQEPWFQRLDPDAQDVVRSRWVESEAQWDTVVTRARHQMIRVVFQSWATLFSVQLVLCFVLGGFLRSFTGGMTVAVLIQNLGWASLAGIALGVVASLARMGEFATTVCTALACSALQLALIHGELMAAPAVFGAPILAGGAARLVALQRNAPLERST